MSKKHGLGTAVAALLSSTTLVGNMHDSQSENDLTYLPIDALQPSKYQPRKMFADTTLVELAASIRAQGILQPILARPLTSTQYEIIAGERRWRAAQLADLNAVPTIIKILDDSVVAMIALIENIQRDALNPLEEAAAFARLINEFAMTHQQIATTVGKSRASITNSLRLLNLAESVKQLLDSGAVEMGHARALLSLPPHLQLELAELVTKRQLSVRQTEQLAQNWLKPQNSSSTTPTPAGQDWEELQNHLSQYLGLPVQFKPSKRGAGKMIIKYRAVTEVTALLARLAQQHE